MIKIAQGLLGTQVEAASQLLMKYVREEAFWQKLAEEFYDTATDDLIQRSDEIHKHIRFMFTEVELTVNIVPYKTAWFGSSVLGHANGNTVFENTRKLYDLTLAERVGHLGHEIVHLFGYSHEGQNDLHSAPVIFGRVMMKYANERLKAMLPNE